MNERPSLGGAHGDLISKEGGIADLNESEAILTIRFTEIRRAAIIREDLSFF
jgi:hypothetical protein